MAGRPFRNEADCAAALGEGDQLTGQSPDSGLPCLAIAETGFDLEVREVKVWPRGGSRRSA